jgi:hypothetical protein
MTLPVLYLTLDTTGVNPGNLITQEPHVSPLIRDLRLIKLGFGAFYTKSLVVTALALNGQTIPCVRGVDYVCIEFLSKESRDYGNEICSAILIINQTLPIDFRFNYQALGGLDNPNNENVAISVRDIANSGLALDWDLIISKPRKFPPAPHIQDIADAYGFEYITTHLAALKNAVGVTGELVTTVTAGPSGIGTINITQAKSAYPVDRFTRPLIDDFKLTILEAYFAFSDLVQAHISTKNVDHQTTATQVGLGQVENRGFAPVVVNGVTLAPYSTPKAIRQAGGYTPTTSAFDHLSNYSNPHNVNKNQVGLSNIQNYGILIDYTTANGNSASYTTDYESTNLNLYLGPRSATAYISDKAQAYKTIKWSAPLSAYLNTDTGILKTVVDNITFVTTNSPTVATSKVTNASNLVTYSSNYAAWLLADREYRLLNANTYFSTVITGLVNNDFARKGPALNKLYQTPFQFTGLEMWLDYTNAVVLAGKIITLSDRVKSRVFTAVGTIPLNVNGGITLDSSKAYLSQTSGPDFVFKPGMTIFTVCDLGADGTTLPILSHRTVSSSGLGDTSLVAHGTLRKAADLYASNSWRLANAPNSSSVSSSLQVNVISLSSTKQSESWLATTNQADLTTYPRGVQPLSDVNAWPATNYVSSPLNTLGSDDPAIQQSGVIKDIIVYNRQLSVAEVKAILNWIKLKYPTSQSPSILSLDFVNTAFHA